MGIVNKTVTPGMYAYTICTTIAAITIGVGFALAAAKLDVRRVIQKRNPLIGTTLVPVFKDDGVTVKGFVVTGQDYDAEDIRPYNPVVDSSSYIIPQS